MKLCSVICSYNAPELTDKVFQQLLKNIPHDIFILENSSDVNKMYTKGSVIDLGRENIGYGGMKDYMFKNFGHYDWVGMFNNDVYDIPENYIEVLMKYMKKDVGIISSAIQDNGTGWNYMKKKGNYHREVESVEDMAAFFNTSLFSEMQKYSPYQYYGVVDIQESMLYKKHGYKRLVVDELCIGHMLSGGREAAGTKEEYYSNTVRATNDWHDDFLDLKELYDDYYFKRHETLSVITPHYNHNGCLRDALLSIINQETKFNVEMIVIDDCSDVDPYDSIKDLPIKYIKNKKNVGLAATRNVGIAASSGEFILPFDADDQLLPGALQKYYEAKNKGDIIYGNLLWMGSEAQLKPRVPIDKEYFITDNQLSATSMYTKEVWKNIGGYWVKKTGSKEHYEDWDFWGRAAALGYDFYYVDYNMYLYNGLPDGMCARVGKNRKENVKICTDHIKKFKKSLK